MRHGDYGVLVGRCDATGAEAGAVVCQVARVCIVAVWEGEILSPELISMRVRLQECRVICTSWGRSIRPRGRL
jgi:hypothetical protein